MSRVLWASLGLLSHGLDTQHLNVMQPSLHLNSGFWKIYSCFICVSDLHLKRYWHRCAMHSTVVPHSASRSLPQNRVTGGAAKQNQRMAAFAHWSSGMAASITRITLLNEYCNPESLYKLLRVAIFIDCPQLTIHRNTSTMPITKNRFASKYDVMKHYTAFHPHRTWQAQTFMEFCMVVVQRVHRHNQLQGLD